MRKMNRKISIAFASGKGGTGKTSLAVNFAKFLSQDKEVLLLDLDVEEPNTRIFFSQNRISMQSKESMINIPCFDNERCDYCGQCAEKCNFNAIVVFKTQISLFNELCKGCGRCKNICHANAIFLKEQKIGEILEYTDQNLSIIEGTLDIGNIHTKSLIKDVKKQKQKSINVYDCPPGTTCPMVESIADVDFVVLVTEPTPFGLHDLTLAIEVVLKLNKKFGIVINKSNYNDPLIEKFCSINKYRIIGKIPFDRSIAERCGVGDFFYNKHSFSKKFNDIYNSIVEALK